MSEKKTIGQRVHAFFTEIGELSMFAGRYFREVTSPPYEFNELLRQSYQIGNRSLLLVGVTGFILGLVFTLQSRHTLMEFGAESWMPSMVAISIVREIGPVITALICAGRVGSGIGAELGSMRVTEQIDALVALLKDIMARHDLKLGAIIGDHVHTGIHTSIYPGRKLWPNTNTDPGEVVQRDIVEQLGIPDARRFIHGFRRTNIAIEKVEMKPSARTQVKERLLSSARARVVPRVTWMVSKPASPASTRAVR